MKYNKLYIIMMILFSLIIFGCAEKQDITNSDTGTHPAGWMEKTNNDFHGAAVLWSVNKANSCQTCHGEDYLGGTSSVSCYTCHAGYPHVEGVSHVSKMPDIHWDIRANCTSCHGIDYKGGDTYALPDSLLGKNCTECHTQAAGPEACNTCHGSAANFAPPVDRLGNTEITEITVGVHQKHLTDTSLTYIARDMDCLSCHPDVNDFGDPTHLDDSVNDPADIMFTSFSNYDNQDPSWNRTTGTCDNVYCHGGFTFRKADSDNDFMYTDSVMVGTGVSEMWNLANPSDPGTDNCVSCHALPPTGHSSAGGCSCHGNWQGGTIVDKSTHIDGKVTVF